MDGVAWELEEYLECKDPHPARSQADLSLGPEGGHRKGRGSCIHLCVCTASMRHSLIITSPTLHHSSPDSKLSRLVSRLAEALLLEDPRLKKSPLASAACPEPAPPEPAGREEGWNPSALGGASARRTPPMGES